MKSKEVKIDNFRQKVVDFGGQGWIRTTEVVDGRFTVCSLWPLGNLPKYNMELVDGLEPPTC